MKNKVFRSARTRNVEYFLTRFFAFAMTESDFTLRNTLQRAEERAPGTDGTRCSDARIAQNRAEDRETEKNAAFSDTHYQQIIPSSLPFPHKKDPEKGSKSPFFRGTSYAPSPVKHPIFGHGRLPFSRRFVARESEAERGGRPFDFHPLLPRSASARACQRKNFVFLFAFCSLIRTFAGEKREYYVLHTSY